MLRPVTKKQKVAFNGCKTKAKDNNSNFCCSLLYVCVSGMQRSRLSEVHIRLCSAATNPWALRQTYFTHLRASLDNTSERCSRIASQRSKAATFWRVYAALGAETGKINWSTFCLCCHMVQQRFRLVNNEYSCCTSWIGDLKPIGFDSKNGMSLLRQNSRFARVWADCFAEATVGWACLGSDWAPE